MRRPRILVIQRVLPHYRRALFAALATSPTVEFAFACGRPRVHSALRSADPDARIRVIRLQNLWIGGESLVVQRGLQRAIANGRFDGIIAEFNPRIVSNVFALVHARLRREKFIWWGQGFGHRAGSIGTAVRLFLARRADALIVYSASQADRFVRLGIPASRVFVAPNSIDVDDIAARRRASGLETRNAVLFIGRLIPAKNIDQLLRAFAASRLPPEARLIVVGDGPEAASLTRLATDLDIRDRTEFTGAVYDESELGEYFNRAWCMVSPGPIGLAAIHSLAYGVPVVIADDAAHGPEAALLRDGVNALRVTPPSVEGFAQAIAALRSSPDTWQRLHENATAVAVGQLGISRMVEAFHRAVAAVLDPAVPS